MSRLIEVVVIGIAIALFVGALFLLTMLVGS